jgi:hypothetical protein
VSIHPRSCVSPPAKLCPSTREVVSVHPRSCVHPPAKLCPSIREVVSSIREVVSIHPRSCVPPTKCVATSAKLCPSNEVCRYIREAVSLLLRSCVCAAAKSCVPPAKRCVHTYVCYQIRTFSSTAFRSSHSPEISRRAGILIHNCACSRYLKMRVLSCTLSDSCTHTRHKHTVIPDMFLSLSLSQSLPVGLTQKIHHLTLLVLF